MTVSQLFIAGNIVDATTNYEIYKRLLEIEEKKADGNPEKVTKPKYNVNDQVFREFVNTLALGTVSKFDYSPDENEIQKAVAKKLKKSVKSLPKNKDECKSESQK